MKLVSAPIISNTEVLPNIYLLQAQAPEIASLAYPGQYVMVRCGEGYDMPLRRPLGIHRISKEGISLLYTVVGRGTEWLSLRKAGELVDLFGPLGKGFEIYPASRNLLLVAGGIGISPVAALAYEAVYTGRKVKLIYAAKDATLIYPDHLLPSEIKIATATEDGSKGHMGMVTDLLSLPDVATEFVHEADQIFVCGPLPMYRAIAKMGSKLGKKPTQVLLETVMGCGVGACLSCSIETKSGRKLVCKDGPVFEFSDILWDKMAAPAVGGRC
jgi:dihydroorotate dehydrogenase electron transfer subunit